MYLLDSNILIYYLEGKKEVRSFIEAQHASLPSISVVSVTELLAQAKLTKKQLSFLLSFLDQFSILEFTMLIAAEAARLKRTHHLLFPDAVVAATATTHHFTLVTRDKNIQKIRELKTINPFQ